MAGAKKSTSKKDLKTKLSNKIRKTTKKVKDSKLCKSMKSKRMKLKEEISPENKETKEELTFCSSSCDNSQSQEDELMPSPYKKHKLEHMSRMLESVDICPLLPDDCELFPIRKNNESALLAMKSTSSGVKLHGCAKVSVICGSCVINGFTLRVGNSPQVIMAPLTHVATTVRPIVVETMQCRKDIYKKYNTAVPNIKDTLDKYEVILLFQSTSIQTLSYPGYPDIFTPSITEVKNFRMLCKQCFLCSTSRYFIEHDSYTEAVNSLPSHDNNTQPYPVVVTTGGKNVGKSTFNRYLVNRLLRDHKHVYYLDCDIGQSEFTPSGFISVTRIEQNQPLLGPTFTNEVKPILMCYYGHNTPSGDPDLYSSCVQFVLQSLFGVLHGNLDGPLVVNTMGWIRALGLQLLIDTIRMVNPTHIMQFQTAKDSRNLAPMTKEFVSSTTGWLTPQSPACHELVTIATSTTPLEIIKYMAPDYRNLAMLSKLSQIADACINRDSSTNQKMTRQTLLGKLQSAQPFKISLKHLQVYNATDSQVKYKHVLAALNASVVALCISPETSKQDLGNEDFIPPAQPCTCIGMGLVRGVDPDNGFIYIVADLNLQQLQEVNCIIRGNSSIPEPLFLEQKKEATKDPPYVTNNFPYETVGSGMFRVHRKFSKLTNDGK
ncbi:polynucleotide 5'-hydroxyl-kinase NOL9-like [Ciona intestinalis]